MNDMKAILIVISMLYTFIVYAQDISPNTETSIKFDIGFNAGIGASYTDKAFLLRF
jgi:hypothetical protein